MGKLSRARRDRTRRPAAPAKRPPLGDTLALSTDAKLMLRAIRDRIDDQGVYRGSDAEAATAAGLPIDRAPALLTALASKGYIRLDRRPAPRQS